jgi:hypothetical protein
MYTGDDVDPDRVRLPRDLAAVRKLVQQLRSGHDARTHMIERVRHSINEGDYENDLKLSVAVDRLMEEIPAVDPSTTGR